MLRRAVWRPPWWAWAVLGLLALVGVDRLTPSRFHGHWLFITPLAIAAGVLIMRKLWDLPPAVMMCAGMALTIFSGAWHQIGLGGLPLDRLLIVGVLLQFLLRAPGVEHSPSLRVRNVHLLMCLTIIYVFTSAVAVGSASNETALLTLIDQFGILPFVMYLVAPSVFPGKRERNMLLGTLLGVGAYLGFTAIFESLGPHALVFPRYILNVDELLPGERAGGPFQSSVAEGFATFSCAVIAIVAFTQWSGRRHRVIAATVTLVDMFGCFLTLERGVWLGAVAGAVVAAGLTRTGRRLIVPAALTCALVIGGALLVSSGLSHKTSARVEDQRSVWDRENQVAVGLLMLKERPLVGFGWDEYTADDLNYFRQAYTYPMVGYSLSSYTSLGKLLPLHELYLAYAVELGVVGLLLWLGCILWGIGGAIFCRGPSELRPWKIGLLAETVCFLVICSVNPDQAPFSALLLWTWAGVAMGSVPQTVRRPALAVSPLRSAVA
jgi:putative inorganic carbon (HCO3(-)) transporter